MAATTIADRKNGETILAEWFNILKQELVSIQDSPIIVSADYVATADFRTIYVDASSADVVITLPDPTLTDNFGKQWTIRVLDNQNFDVSVDCTTADFENIFDPGLVVNPYVFKGNEIGASFQSNGSAVWRIRNNYSLPVMDYDYTSDLISPLNANCSIASLNDILFNQYLSSINGEGLVKYESSKWQMSSDSGVTWFDVVGALNTQSIANKIITGSSLSDSQLILKTDTKANLITYAITATNGELVFSSDEELYYGIVSGLLVSLGGGGSSAFLGLTDTPSSYTGQKGKVAKVNDTETAIVFEEESGGGSPSLYLNLDADIIRVADFIDNTVNGSFTEDTAETDNIRYKLTNAVGADGEDVVFTKAIASDVQKRRTHICKIYNSEYDGTLGSVTLVLTDQDDNVLETIIIDPSVNYQKKIFTTTDTVTSIKVKPTIVTGEVSTWVFDKVVLDYHVLGEANLEIRETITYTGRISRATDGKILLKTPDSSNDNNELVTVTNTDHTRYTFLKATEFTGTIATVGTVTTFDSFIIMYNSAGVELRRSGGYAQYYRSGVLTGKAAAGDYLVMWCGDSPTDIPSTNFSVTATATADYVLVEDERQQAHFVGKAIYNLSTQSVVSSSAYTLPTFALSNSSVSGGVLQNTTNAPSITIPDAKIGTYIVTATGKVGTQPDINTYFTISDGTVNYSEQGGYGSFLPNAIFPIEVTAEGDLNLDFKMKVESGSMSITATQPFELSVSYLPPAEQASVPTVWAIPKIVHQAAEYWTGDYWDNGTTKRKIYARSFELTGLAITGTVNTILETIDPLLTNVEISGSYTDNNNETYSLDSYQTAARFSHTYYDQVNGYVRLSSTLGAISINEITLKVTYTK